VEDFSQAIRLAPKYAIAYNNLGAAYCFKGEIDLSISAYSRAISLDPESGEAASAFYGRGLSLCFKDDFKRAVEDYDRAIKLRPDYAEAYNNRGVALKEMGHLHEAIESSIMPSRSIRTMPRPITVGDWRLGPGAILRGPLRILKRPARWDYARPVI